MCDDTHTHTRLKHDKGDTVASVTPCRTGRVTCVTSDPFKSCDTKRLASPSLCDCVVCCICLLMVQTYSRHTHDWRVRIPSAPLEHGKANSPTLLCVWLNLCFAIASVLNVQASRRALLHGRSCLPTTGKTCRCCGTTLASTTLHTL